MKKLEIVLLIILFSISFFTHFYKLFEYFNLTGDPGRDGVVVYDIIVNKKLTLLGPKSSAGGFYYGPLYFYLLLPVYLMTGLNPVAAPLFSATVGVITVFLLYFITKEMFNRETAFFTSALYTVSPFIIEQARHGWNPSLLPTTALLAFYFFYKFLIKNEIKDLLLWGFFFGMALQFHFVIIFSLPVYLAILIYKLIKKRISLMNLFFSFLAITIFFTPLFIFELRHQFITTKGFIKFLRFGPEKRFFGVTQSKEFHPPMSFSYYSELISNTIKSLIPLLNNLNKFLIVFFLTLLILITYFQYQKKEKREGILGFYYILFLFFGSLFALGFYSGPIHPYIYLFVGFLPVILIGKFLASLFSQGVIFKFLSGLIFSFVIMSCFFELPFWQKPKRTIKEEKEVAKIIADDAKAIAKDLPINVVMFSDLDAAYSAYEYRYLVKYYGKEVLPPENYRGAEKLYIVAERKVDDPVNQPVMEIREFRPKTIEKKWQTKAGYMIYRLGR